MSDGLGDYYVGGEGQFLGLPDAWGKLDVAGKAIVGFLAVLLIALIIVVVVQNTTEPKAESFMPSHLALQQEFDGMPWSQRFGREGLNPGVERAKTMATMSLEELGAFCKEKDNLPGAWDWVDEKARRKDVANIPPVGSESFVGAKSTYSDSLLSAKLLGQ